jgi:hypothetical protein
MNQLLLFDLREIEPRSTEFKVVLRVK